MFRTLPECRAEALLQLGDGIGLEGLDGAVAEDAHRFKDMVACATINQRVRAARIVAHHSTNAAAVAGRGLGAEKQPVGLEGGVQLVANHPRFYPCPTLLCVNLEDMVPVTADVDDNACAHHLASKRCAASARNEVCLSPTSQ